MIDDPDIERAAERIEARLDELRAEVVGVRADLADLATLVEALLQEARGATENLRRMKGGSA